jgi:glycosyltransferase involved in cell wall biosynthesis
VTISLVLPCYNEVENLPATVADAVAWFSARDVAGEIIVVDDGSTDGSGALLRDLATGQPRLRVVEHATNRGYGHAVRSGCDAAETAWIAFMDSDGQFRAADLDRLTAHMASHELIVGIRDGRADPLIRTLNTRLYTVLIRAVLGVRVRDPNCAMKLFTRAAWARVRPRYGLGALFNAELFQRAQAEGIAWRQVPVSHHPRRHGQATGANPKVIARMFRELLALRRDMAREVARAGMADRA